MITITEIAKDRIKERLGNDFLRLSLSGGGCNGFQYMWDLHEGKPNNDDFVIEDRIVIDSFSMPYLHGTIICLLYTSPSPRD